jgi:hypothetical protein
MLARSPLRTPTRRAEHVAITETFFEFAERQARGASRRGGAHLTMSRLAI